MYMAAPAPKNHANAMELLEQQLAPFGMQLGLERIKQAMHALGNPEKSMNVVLIGGTNGKGSTTAYLSGMLSAAGYKTGSFYSPHLIDYNERFQINGRKITSEKMHEYASLVLPVAEKSKMTFFEALTAMAYLYFADNSCRYAVMEVGLGGRLDATNIADERLSVIASIGMDHMQHLGSTPEKIAFEKAGILKKGTGIIGAVDAEPLAVISSEAAKRNVPLKVLGRDFKYTLTKNTHDGTRFSYSGKSNYSLKTCMVGSYQALNGALAVAAAEELGLSEIAIREGLKARIPGRMQLIHQQPYVVVDGAHNVPAFNELIENLKLFPHRRLLVLFAAMKDKEWKKELRMLAPKASLVVTTAPSEEQKGRSEAPGTLAFHASKYTESIAVDNVMEAYCYALTHANKNDLVLVCGSLYLAGELLRGLGIGQKDMI